MSLEDRAQEHELRVWEQVNRANDKPVRFKPTDPGYGPEYCLTCDVNSLPVARRIYGYTTCIECQETLENQRRR